MSPEQWISATWGDAQAGDYVKVNGIEFRVIEVDHPRITCKRSGSTAQAVVGTPPLDKVIELQPMHWIGDKVVTWIPLENGTTLLLSDGSAPAPVSVDATSEPVVAIEPCNACGMGNSCPEHDPQPPAPNANPETERLIKVGCCGGFRGPNGEHERCDPCPDPLVAADAARKETRAVADAQFAELKAMREAATGARVDENDAAVVEQFKTDLPALRALRPLLGLVEQFEPAIKEVSGALAGAGREVVEAYAAALREISDVVYRAQFALPEPTPGDMTEERAAYKVIETNGLQPKVIGRVLALPEITKHLTEMHANYPLPARGPLTGIEYRGQLHDLHFEAHAKAQLDRQPWSERGTVSHTHAVMDRPMR